MNPKNTNITSLYDFLLQQMAAESYLEDKNLYSDIDRLKVALQIGTNRTEFTTSTSPNDDNLPGLTRMTSKVVAADSGRRG